MTARQLATPASDGEREFWTAVGGLGQRSSGAVGKVAPCRIRRDGRRKVFALGQPRFRAGWLVERRGESGGARVRRLTRHRQPVRELHLQVLGLHRGAAGGRGRRRISKKAAKKAAKFFERSVPGVSMGGVCPRTRAPGAGRRGARAHLCAALTLTVADPFLPGRRVDASAPRDLFLCCSFMGANNEQLRRWGGRPALWVLPPSHAPAGFPRAPRADPTPPPPRLRRSPPTLAARVARSAIPSPPSANVLMMMSHALSRFVSSAAGVSTDRVWLSGGEGEICARAVAVGRTHGNARAHRGCDTLRDVAEPLASVASAAGD